MGNAALKYDAAFEHDAAFEYDPASDQALPDPRLAPKYHASFYDAAPYDEAVGAMAYRVRRETPDIRGRRDAVREPAADRRFERDSDSSRPRSGHFEHRNRVGVSRAPHSVDVDRVGSDGVGWRSMATGVVVTAAAVLGLVGLAAVSTGGASDPDGATSVVRVAAGESLSDIAADIAPGQSVGVVIERIMDLNAMNDSRLNVGQTLIVPAAQGR